MQARSLEARAGEPAQTRLGSIVRDRRRQMGLTQDELAHLSRLDEEQLSQIEHGAASVTLRSIVSLADTLHVTVGNLLARSRDFDEPPHPVGQAPAAKQEILMVEDSPTDAVLTERTLRRTGITTPLWVVPSAEEAMEYLFGNGRYTRHGPTRPQLILLDLNLPRMSGLEFLRGVKGFPSTLHIPVVILTASRSDQMIEECGRLGAESFVIKPLGIGSVVRATPNLSLRHEQKQPV